MQLNTCTRIVKNKHQASIQRSFSLHVNFEENQVTKNCLYSYCHGSGTYLSLTIKTTKFVLLTCLLPFLAPKESRFLEKKVNGTQILKSVFIQPHQYEIIIIVNQNDLNVCNFF